VNRHGGTPHTAFGRRHRLPTFPAKEDLIRAVVEDRFRRIVDDGHALPESENPGEALFTFLRSMVVQWGATDRGLVGFGIDIETAMPDAEEDFVRMLDDCPTGTVIPEGTGLCQQGC
jgi:hypothetical protein